MKGLGVDSDFIIDEKFIADLLRAKCDRLRQTADELKAGTIHPHHAANRIRKIADEIAKEKA